MLKEQSIIDGSNKRLLVIILEHSSQRASNTNRSNDRLNNSAIR